MTTFVPEQFEPIKNIEFDAEQNWFGKTVDKIKINFADEEDLQLLLLNIFVHDFGHDYNFLGDSYLRRIVSNIKELDSLGIENGNKILKSLVDIISGEPRVPFMYNDNIFVDVDDPEYLSQDLKDKKQQFYERLNGFEGMTTKQKQLSEVGEQLDEKYAEQQLLAEEVAREKPLTEKEQLKKKEGKLEGGEVTLESHNPLSAKIKSTLPKSALELKEGKRDAIEAIEDLGKGKGTKIQDETTDLTVVPPLSSLKVDISNYIKARANDPESLEMLSTLKLYITSYLGPNYYTSLIPESVDPTSDAFYRYYMHYSVITTFYGLICYYDDIVKEHLVDERMSNITTMFSNLLLILLASYLEFVNDAGQDYFSRENALDPLSILDSDQVMNNYNRLFAEYVQSNESEFDEFKSKLLSEYDIVEDTKEEKVGGGDDDPEEERPYLADEDDGSDELVPLVTPLVTPLEKSKYKYTFVTRSYGVFHNNLLTTVARGIFLKSGVWQKIYPPAPGDKAVDFPGQFKYDKELPKTFSQQFDEWKTGELSLITNITKELLQGRGFKNDLLIAEILILKHMLIEILPDFLYLANGIDDRLRNFLEVYLYKCGNYDADLLKSLSEEDLRAIEVAAEQEANAKDLEFIDNDPGDGEEPVYGGSAMTGGVNTGPGTIYDVQRKKNYFSTDALSKKKPQLSKDDVERAYKLNMDVIRNLTESGIPTITLEDGKVVNNMFELLKMNTGMIKRDGSDFSYPAPKKRFILDNASKLNRNINGLKLFHGRDALDNLAGDADYKELLKKFGMAQKFFGLYKTLKRGVVCAGSSMLDAMDNCSLEKGATEPKEVGTTNFEFVFDDPVTGKHFSYGGVVLFYKGTNKNGEENINVHIDFSLKTKLGREDPDDVAHVVVDELDVADSEDLKARIVYKSIIKEVNSLFKCAFRFEEPVVPPLEGDEGSLNPELKRQMRELAIIKMRALWSFLQYNPYSQTNPVFNRLLGKTGVKNLGDFLQESQGTIKWGGYVNTIEGMDEAVKEFIRRKNIDENSIIYRSVSKRKAIIPYDENGDALRLAVEGDRPSAFRAIYFVLFALTNGFKEGINSMTIAGYLQLTRSILVSRNEPFIRVEPPPVRPILIGVDSLKEDGVRSRSSSAEERNSSRPPSPFAAAAAEEESGLPRKEKNLDALEFRPCPIPYGKVIYVNSEAKNINIKAVEIKDPQIKKPKTLEEFEKKLKTVSKSKSTKSKSSESIPPLTPEEITMKKFKIKRDIEELEDQINIGSSIPRFSELKDIECSRADLKEEPADDESIGLAALGVSTGGKTRKHKKLLKKKTNTRNKNKTKKAKKSKKTIKHRNKVQKRHKKTR